MWYWYWYRYRNRNRNMTGTGSAYYYDECDTRSDIGTANSVHVGAPYMPGDAIPAGLKLLLALIDGSQWPLHVEGDTGVGVNADAWGGIKITECEYITKIDDGPVTDGQFPADPPIYPGVGITAYGCQLNCSYIISGSLGSSVIVGKIDGQWHILRVLGSASTIPLFGPSNDCRCCGNALKDVKLRAKVVYVSSQAGDYRACDIFLLDPVSTSRGYNPLEITVSCNSTVDSVLENIADWEVRVLGDPVEITSLSCCAEFPTDCTRVVYDPSERCECVGTGSGTGTGTGTAVVCRFELNIRFTHLGIEYYVLIYQDVEDVDDDPCTEFADEYIEDVIAEAAGLPNLDPGDRVIMARIPGGLAGRTALDGVDPIEWFIIRACNSMDCAYPCDTPPPQGPPCCGVLCSEMPNGLTATVEILASDCCAGSLAIPLTKEGVDTQCDGAADTTWFAHDLLDPTPPEIVICTGTSGIYPTKVAINNLELICGSAENECAGTGTGTGTGTAGDVLGPIFSLWVSYYGAYAVPATVSTTLATQNRTVSCCSPLYLEYEITIPVCFVAGAGVVNASTTLRITITE
jgi:hypothetical protein